VSTDVSTVPADLRDRVEQMSWYHTIDIVDGLTTNGWFDLRPHVHHYGLPERMDGMRVLDIGTWDGF
jgi:tRNA (mo5U34)-methyltransferase